MKAFKSQLNEVRVEYNRTKTNNRKITSSSIAETVLKEVFPTCLDHREAMICLFLNNANNTCGFTTISIGGVSSTVVDLKMIFQHALLCNASGIILCHNHPSGSLKPSEADIKLTERVKNGAKTLDLSLLDHLIITSESYYSFSDEGLI